ncbi:MAG: flagellar basal-body rod protein FlgG [Candidatus Firestonebacteria bacterium]|nr:flagellar basal-body rod protein FlgG [Candidatus Firestonebacteria bacterium]
MMNSLWISATGMSAQQMNMDTISNNLANANTTAFKTSRAQFADIFFQQTQAADETAAAGSPLSVGLGSRNMALSRMFSQGTIISTGNALDLAIQGDGFFQVQRADGSTAYTRDGSLRVDGEGKLSTAQGYALSPEIQIPSDAQAVTVGIDGTVSVTTAGSAVPRVVGQLELCRFLNPAGLTSEGQNLYTATTAAGEPTVNTPGQDGLGSLVPGSLEQSNVNLVQEMVNMIQTQRAYEVNSKAVQATDEMMRMANSLRAG